MRNYFLIIILIIQLGFLGANGTALIDEPLDEWMPPIDVDWTCEMGDLSGNMIASPIPNVDSVLWSVGGEAPDKGFSLSVERGGFPLAPLIIEDIIIIYDSESIFALDLNTGELKWGSAIYGDSLFPWYVDKAFGLGVFITSVALNENYLFIATSADIYQERGRVVCLTISNGSLVWVQILPGEAITAITSNIIVVGDRVYVGTIHFTHTVYCLNAETGEIAWQTELDKASNIRGISYSQDKLFVTNEYGDIYALNSKTGEILWSVNPGSLGLSIPAIKDNYIYLTSGVGELIKIDINNGEIIKKKNFGATPKFAPQIYNDKIFIIQSLGETKGLIAIDMESWEIVWKFTETSIKNFITKPIITEGKNAKIVIGAEGMNENEILAVYLNGSLAWKYITPERPFILSVSKGKLVLAQLGENRFEGKITVFGEYEKPVIRKSEQKPIKPKSIDEVVIICDVFDEKSGIYNAVLSWSKDQAKWSHKIMSLNESGKWTANINAQPNGTTIYYKITVIDNVGNWISSDIYSYTVYDPPIPPSIRILEIQNGTIVEKDEITVEWNVTRGSFSIRKIEIRIDNEDWIDVTGKDKHTFKKISEGQHTITIRALDEKGLTSQSNVSITVRLPQPKLNLTFIAIGVIVAVAVIGGIAVILKRKS